MSSEYNQLASPSPEVFRVEQMEDISLDMLEESRQNLSVMHTQTDSNMLYQHCFQLLKAGGLAAEIPRLVVFGQQSMGKTTLLDYIMGGPIGYSSTTTGTRHPVVIMLKALEKGQKPSASLDGVEMDLSQLPDAMRQLMENSPTISEKEVLVELRVPGAVSALFVDLPGIKDDSREGAELTRSVVRSYVKNNPHDMYLLVKKASDDPANWPYQLREFILQDPPKGLGLKARQTMVVGTRAVDFLKGEANDVSTHGQLLKRVKDRAVPDPAGNTLPLFLLELFSLGRDLRDSPDFAARRNGMHEQIQNGRRQILELLTSQFSGEQTSNESRKTLFEHFDIELFKKTLNVKFQNLLNEQLSNLERRLHKRRLNLQRTIADLEVRVSDQSTKSMRELIKLFVRELMSRVNEMVTGNYNHVLLRDAHVTNDVNEGGLSGENFMSHWGGTLEDNLREGHDLACELFPRGEYEDGFLNKVLPEEALVNKKKAAKNMLDKAQQNNELLIGKEVRVSVRGEKVYYGRVVAVKDRMAKVDFSPPTVTKKETGKDSSLFSAFMGDDHGSKGKDSHTHGAHGKDSKNSKRRGSEDQGVKKPLSYNEELTRDVEIVSVVPVVPLAPFISLVQASLVRNERKAEAGEAVGLGVPVWFRHGPAAGSTARPIHQLMQLPLVSFSNESEEKAKEEKAKEGGKEDKTKDSGNNMFTGSGDSLDMSDPSKVVALMRANRDEVKSPLEPLYIDEEFVLREQGEDIFVDEGGWMGSGGTPSLFQIAGDYAETKLLNQLSLTALGRWLKFHVGTLEPDKNVSEGVLLQMMRSVQNVADKADWEPVVADLLQVNVHGGILFLARLASSASAVALRRILRASVHETCRLVKKGELTSNLRFLADNSKFVAEVENALDEYCNSKAISCAINMRDMIFEQTHALHFELIEDFFTGCHQFEKDFIGSHTMRDVISRVRNDVLHRKKRLGVTDVYSNTGGSLQPSVDRIYEEVRIQFWVVKMILAAPLTNKLYMHFVKDLKDRPMHLASEGMLGLSSESALERYMHDKLLCDNVSSGRLLGRSEELLADYFEIDVEKDDAKDRLLAMKRVDEYLKLAIDGVGKLRANIVKHGGVDFLMKLQ